MRATNSLMAALSGSLSPAIAPKEHPKLSAMQWIGWSVVLALFVTGIATIMGGINYVTTVIRLRAPGMTWMRMPLTVWGLWLTAILNVLFVPVLGSAGLLLIFGLRAAAI